MAGEGGESWIKIWPPAQFFKGYTVVAADLRSDQLAGDVRLACVSLRLDSHNFFALRLVGRSAGAMAAQVVDNGAGALTALDALENAIADAQQLVDDKSAALELLGEFRCKIWCATGRCIGCASEIAAFWIGAKCGPAFRGFIILIGAGGCTSATWEACAASVSPLGSPNPLYFVVL